MKKILSAIIPLVLAGFLIPSLVFSQEAIIHPKEATHDGNYFRIGQSIEVDGAVTKDVIVFGQSITINGPVGGDVIAAGQDVIVKGPVAGNIRIAGEHVTIEGTVGKNVTVAGQSISLGDASHVGWDASLAGGGIALNGSVDGSVHASGETIALAGTVAGAFQASASRQLAVGPKAHIGKTFEYHAPTPAEVGAGATIPAATYAPLSEADGKEHRSGSVFWSLVFLFGAWIVGLVLLTLAPELVKRLEATVEHHLWPVIGWGVVAVLLTPILAAVLVMTLIGIPLAVLVMIHYVLLLYTTKIIAGYLLGAMMVKKMQRTVPPMAVLLVGVLVFVLLLQIPVVGTLVGLVGAFVTFGAVLKLSPLLAEKR